ncbi:MAG: polyprenyl synthetase family protein [Gammaproteobacteria bacterium]|nr:polyprenyl synthetase family protein [Gammaproteobacteria bacterium]
MPLDSIRSLVLADLEATNTFLTTELQSPIPIINQLIEYVLAAGGKRIRPLLVLLSARTANHHGAEAITLASAIELIHTATLLHDDVVDNSSLRRGNATAHTIWGNEASVLVGDFIYSRAFQLIVKLQNLTVMNIFADATNLIAEGEVLQLVNCHDPDTTEEAYFAVIQRKTGKLFEVGAQLGPALAQSSAEQLNFMQTYGMHLGIAYQLIDDALDYNASVEEMGKNVGNDLAEGKPTLPLIYAMRKGTPTEVALIRKSIETGTSEQLDSILEIIESTGAIHYTAQAAKIHAGKANSALIQMPNSPYRKALHDLAEFVVERSY